MSVLGADEMRRVIGSSTRVATALVISVVLAIGAVPATLGHNNYLHCEYDFSHMRWAAAAVTYSYPSGWATSYKNAIDNAAADFRNNTVFDYNRLSSGATAPWANWNDPDNLGLAGVTLLALNHTTCRITDAAFYFNVPHFDPSQGGTNHSQDQKQCTAVHEFGHGVGLTHVASGSSVMLADHNARCHNQLIKVLQPEDRNDINSLY